MVRYITKDGCTFDFTVEDGVTMLDCTKNDRLGLHFIVRVDSVENAMLGDQMLIRGEILDVRTDNPYRPSGRDWYSQPPYLFDVTTREITAIEHRG